MRVINGNLWDTKDNVILVTCNSFLTKEGKLTMGRGAALEMKTKFPGVDYRFGKMLKYYYTHLGEYNILMLNPYSSADNIVVPKFLLGIFQVKYHFKDSADIELIERSVFKLNDIISKSGDSVSMNYPGIGFGHLNYNVVQPIVEKLDDRVTLYTYKEI